ARRPRPAAARSRRRSPARRRSRSRRARQVAPSQPLLACQSSSQPDSIPARLTSDGGASPMATTLARLLSLALIALGLLVAQTAAEAADGSTPETALPLRAEQGGSIPGGP